MVLCFCVRVQRLASKTTTTTYCYETKINYTHNFEDPAFIFENEKKYLQKTQKNHCFVW